MLDRDLIRKDPEFVRRAIARKGLPAPVDEFLAADRKWRETRSELESLLAEVNRESKSIGAFMAQGKKDEAEAAKQNAGKLKGRITELEAESRSLEAELTEIELSFPNIPDPSVPDGKDESENVVLRSWGEPAPKNEWTRPHWEIAESLGLFDLPRGAKIAGSGFILYTGVGAKLQRALGAFMADYQASHNGYLELYPPSIANRSSLIGTGNLPKFEDDLYKTTDDLFLIPTAEVPVTNFYRDEIIDGSQLPVRFAAWSSCFRREAGAAGKDTRGLLRVHQFDKVELVWFCRPEESLQRLQELIGHAESILQALGLHYRVIELCAGDLGAKGAKCCDLEVWAPAVERFLEISSCSTFEAYQSRRANIRFRREPGAKPEFVHILNGSGLAVPRLYAAILETGIQPDGSVKLPEVLWPYMGMQAIPAPKA